MQLLVQHVPSGSDFFMESWIVRCVAARGRAQGRLAAAPSVLAVLPLVLAARNSSASVSANRTTPRLRKGPPLVAAARVSISNFWKR